MTTLLGNETGAPATLIDALPAAPPRVSLLSSAIVVDQPDGEWLNGMAYLPEGCDEPELPYWWACPEGEAGHTPQAYQSDESMTVGKAIPDGESVVRFRPFDIWHGVACTVLQFRAEDWQARARRALAAVQSTLIERELVTGAIATAAGFPNDYLAAAPTVLGTFSPETALAELEQAGASRPSMIHAPPRIVSQWLSRGLVAPFASGRQLVTGLGTVVVPGSGYPAGNSTSASAYVTGLVRVWLGPVKVLTTESAGNVQDADYDAAGPRERTGGIVNDLVVRVERAVAYTYDPCFVGVVAVEPCLCPDPGVLQ